MRGEFVVFFFSSRSRHTRYWRDWSSDVCSSDLAHHADRIGAVADIRFRLPTCLRAPVFPARDRLARNPDPARGPATDVPSAGRARPGPAAAGRAAGDALARTAGTAGLVAAPGRA